MHTHSLTSLGIIKYLKKVQSITENSRLLTLMEAPHSTLYFTGKVKKKGGHTLHNNMNKKASLSPLKQFFKHITANKTYV